MLGVPGGLLVDSHSTGATVGGILLLAMATYLAAFSVIYFNVVLTAAADQVMRGEDRTYPGQRRRS